MTDNRTTELREKLTERGMKWVAYEKELSLALKDFHDTRWDASGVRWSYLEINGKATLSPVGRVEIELTPDQAIAATLGSGTCELKWTLQGETQTQEFWRCECGNCGYWFGAEDRSTFPFKMTIDKVDVPNYCPNCGAKVVG